MTIFGFNTDVKAGDTVYHVQSEARVQDLLLQTQVFIKGQCVGKRASSYAERSVQLDFSTEEMHEALKSQHRAMLDAVKAGRMTEMFLSDGEVQDINGQGLAVKWLNADSAVGSGKVTLRLLVTDGSRPVDGALLTSRLTFESDAPIHSQSMTEENGIGELEIAQPAETAGEIAFLVRAKSDDKSVTRKFRIRH